MVLLISSIAFLAGSHLGAQAASSTAATPTTR